MFSNKKAAGESNLGKIILVALLVLIIAYLLYFFFIKNFVEKTLTACPDSYCKDACDFASEYRDGTKICKTSESQVCCKPVNPKSNPASPLCKGKNIGDTCDGNYKVCDEIYNCVTKCEFCTNNPSNAICTFTASQVLGKRGITAFTGGFSCGCTRTECQNTNSFTCISGFCPSTNPAASDYYCCNK